MRICQLTQRTLLIFTLAALQPVSWGGSINIHSGGNVIINGSSIHAGGHIIINGHDISINNSSVNTNQVSIGSKNNNNISDSSFKVVNFGPTDYMYQGSPDINITNSYLQIPIVWDGTDTDFKVAPIYFAIPDKPPVNLTVKNVAIVPYSADTTDSKAVVSNITVKSTPGTAIYSPFFAFLEGDDHQSSSIGTFTFAKLSNDKKTTAPSNEKESLTILKQTLYPITTTDGKTIYIQKVKLTEKQKEAIKSYSYVDDSHKKIDYDYAYRFYVPCDPNNPEKDCTKPVITGDGGLPTSILPIPGEVGEVLFRKGANRSIWTHYQSYYDRALYNPNQPHTVRLVYEHSHDVQLANLQWAWLAHTDQHQRHYWLTAQAGHIGIPHHDLFRYNLMGAVQQQLEHAKKLNYDFKIGFTGFDLPTMRILPTATLELWRTFHTQHQWIFEPQVQVSTMANFNRHAKFHDVTTRVGVRTYYKDINGIINYRYSRFQAGAFHNHSQSLEGILNYNRTIRKNATFNAQVGYQQDLQAHKGSWSVGLGWRLFI